MKFLCDRCKTRYSIGDDRVRGKILKIRCKNCANVITVREGMSDADASGPARGRSATGAPAIANAAPAGALGAAFASQLAKPPPALEAEWYVSIEGDQSGPFSLAEAQRWVASKPFEADLHCWSEGFDDWLPVDKVSHFRGLRKKPLPAPAPPPIPRPAPRLAAVEDDRPLFAATMAVIEKGSGPTRMPGTAAAPAAPSAPLGGVTGPMSKSPSAPVQAKTNGSSGPAPIGKAPSGPTAKGTANTPALPRPGAAARGGTAQGVGPAMSPGAKALAEAFDNDPAESMTSVDSPAFDDRIATAAEPVAAKRALGALAEPPMPERKPVAPPPELDEENLEIGEVSRVVKLADLAKMGAPGAPGASPAASRNKLQRAPLRATGSAPKLAGAEIAAAAGIPAQYTGMTGPVPLMDGTPGETFVGPSLKTQRRGMIVLLAAAGVLLAGVLAAVVLLLTGNSDDDTPMGLGKTHEINTDRPEDIVRKVIAQATGSATPTPNRNPVRHYTPGNHVMTGSNPQEEVTDPTKRELESDEVEDVARKQGDGTNFCYKRAQRGALGLEIQDLKSLQVTLTVDKEGSVNDVSLSSHGGDSFGTCLMARIKGWKFRQSSGTKTFRITLVFSHA